MDKNDKEFIVAFGVSLIMISLAVMLVGCAGGSGSSPTIAAVTSQNPEDVIPSDLIAPDVDPSASIDATATLTYYKLSRTEAPITNWASKVYTATGFCVVYNSHTYCWDDGVKTVSIPPSYTFKYTYFGLQGTAQNWNHCYGGCSSDLMPLPRFISSTLQNNITPAVINAVFTNGTPKTVSCTESSGVLNCGDFVIDLNQGAL